MTKPDQVEQLKQALSNLASERRNATALQEKLRAVEKSVEVTERRCLEIREEIDGLMRDLDVLSTGNAGYESRRFEVLVAMADTP